MTRRSRITVAVLFLAVTNVWSSGDALARQPDPEDEAGAQPEEPPEQPAEPPAPEPEPAPPPAAAEPPPAVAPEPTVAPDNLGDDLEEDFESSPGLFSTSIYGYVDVQWRELAFTTGLPAMKEEKFPIEFRKERGGGWLNLNVMAQGDIDRRFKWFINLGVVKAADINKGDATLEVRNGWVEVPLYRDLLRLRGGKTYRRFGLYNEILDAAPTFPGVEQPAFLVEGQLLLTRTTNVMLHGTKLFGEHQIQYALHTGTDERAGARLPIGGDLRFQFGDLFTVGSSSYWGRAATATRLVGEGQAIGGVKNWVERDDFFVFGGYGQLTLGGLLFQVEYWHADHDARRNPDEVLKFAGAAELNMRRRDRFFNGVDMPQASDVNIDADYVIRTAWSRLAYEIPLGGAGALTPYVHLDYYSDPETIPGGKFGGNEAGLSDDGDFYRTVMGFVYRPLPPVAFKAELNPHFQTVAGERATFAPFQVSLSYFWNLGL